MRAMNTLFFDEARENLDSMEQWLLALESRGMDREQLNAIFRSAHSIKGGAAAFGMDDVAGLTHLMESLLDRLRGHQTQPIAVMLDLLLESVETVRGMLLRHQSGSSGLENPSGLLLHRLRTAALDPEPLPATRLLEIRIGPIERIESADAVLQLFRDIPGLGEIAVLPVEHNDTRTFTVRTSAADSELLDLFALHVDRHQVSICAADASAAPVVGTTRVLLPAEGADVRASDEVIASVPVPVEVATIRVAVSKIDDLGGLADELDAAMAALERSCQALDVVAHAQVLADLNGLGLKMRVFRPSVLAIRRMPMALAFRRFARVLRDLSIKFDKKFALVTQGEGVELDKAWVEKIADPLTHLVRNSCDHGIETADERRAAGKPEVGTITLSVVKRPEATVIEVRDDGRGLVRENVVRVARGRGIHVPDQMPDNEVWQLVFVPGLSTANAVTDVSGRGVGMDVVRHNVAALGGTVEVASVPGQGTCVSMRLPPFA